MVSKAAFDSHGKLSKPELLKLGQILRFVYFVLQLARKGNTADSAPVLPPGGLLEAHVIFCRYIRSDQCLFQTSCGVGESPQTAAKLCALNLFIGRNNELQLHVYHGNFLLMDNKHRSYSSKGCTFSPKMHHQSTFDCRWPGPAGEVYALPQIR